MHFKDAILNQLAEQANVAQFVSFSPTLEQRYSRIFSYEANHSFASLSNAITAILAQSSERSVNIRSFDPVNPKSREFIYGKTDAQEVEAAVRRLADAGLHTIVNETIDIEDGGVSGVVLGDVIEFAPGDTPRAVEKPGTAALPRDVGLRLLETVYGFTPDVDYGSQVRVEFSIHPLRRGFRHEHTIIWELEDVDATHGQAEIRWPNRFSTFIGDKAYGLLIAHLLSLPVPAATVVARKVAPFTFGQPTGSAEVWIRTCPTEQVPGKFTTQRGWLDPFMLMQKEDPGGDQIASLLAQVGVEAVYSGGLVATTEGDITIEGTRGFGEEFMTGRMKRTEIPDDLKDAVRALYEQAAAHLGPVRMEWVADEEQVWVVQLHRGATESYGQTIFPGEPTSYRQFDVKEGLEALRALVNSIEGTDEGLILIGDVGITSHFGDVLRRARIPSRLEPAAISESV